MTDIWRCDVTQNPVGTDTEMIGRPCQCQGCRAAAEIERIKANAEQAWVTAGMATDEIERLKDINLKQSLDVVNKFEEKDAEIARLRAAIEWIDGINDNPAHYSPAINEVCRSILRPGAASKPDDDAVRVLTRDDPTGRRRLT